MKYLLLVAACVIIGLLAKKLKPKLRGNAGEKKVAAKLAALPPKEYLVLNDVILKTQSGSTQIDHVVISVYGIFVLETKNYSGTVYGSDASADWFEVIRGKKYYFHNPTRQNYGHVVALAELLDLPKERFIPAVVFLRDASLRITTKSTVVFLSNLPGLFEQHKVRVFTEDEILAFKETIVKGSSDTKISVSDHVANVKKDIKQKEERVRQNICPSCGGRLVPRKSKRGASFYGCSNYPKCRFTKRIN